MAQKLYDGKKSIFNLKNIKRNKKKTDYLRGENKKIIKGSRYPVNTIKINTLTQKILNLGKNIKMKLGDQRIELQIGGFFI